MTAIQALTIMIERVNLIEACLSGFDGACNGIECTECPFYSEENRDAAIAELKGDR
jgi:hypothetical protein